MKKETIYTIIMECVLLCLIAGSLSAALLASLHIEFNLLYIMVLTSLVCTVLRFMLKNKKTTLMFIPLAFILFLAIGFLSDPQNFLSSIINYFSWLIAFMTGGIGLHHSYAAVTVFIITALIGTIFYVLNIKYSLFTIPFIGGLTLLFILWFLGHDQITLYIWFFAIGSIMSWGGSYHRTLSKKFKIPNRGFWQASVLPIAILITLTATLIVPSQDTKNLQWDYLIDTIDKIEDEIFGFRGPRKPFRLSSTGFPSSPNSLGGPVKVSEELALTVHSPMPLLLRGTVLNEYTGSSWIGTVLSSRYKYTDNDARVTRESTYGIDEYIWSEIDPTMQTDPFYLPIEATITHKEIKTSVLFHPHSLTDIEIRRNRSVPYFNKSSELFASRELREDESYTVVSTVPILASSISFQDYLRTVSPSLDQKQSVDFYTEDQQYNKKIRHIYQNYIQVPDSVPDRVRTLTNLLTKDKSTNYDKMIAIMDYLSDNYGYTLSPPETPAKRDFVDYFLFDLKEGYCTYFASAMAIMGRIAGVPTRYVEGFTMPDEPGSDGLYEVRNINGHAWIEVYFPEVGWVPMDPTPASGVGVAPPTQQIPQSNRYWEEYYRKHHEQMRQEQQQGGQQDPDMDYELYDEFFKRALLIVASLIVSLAIIIAIVVLLLYILRRRRFKKLPSNDQFYYYYNEILWLLKLYGRPIYMGETPYAYAAKIDKWLVNPKGSMRDISELLIKSEFGNKKLTKDSIEFTREFYMHVRTSMKEVLGYPKFTFKTLMRKLSPARHAVH